MAMLYEYELIAEIKQYAKIIVYGAEFRGRCVIRRLKNSFPLGNIFSAISDTEGKIDYCEDCLVRDISYYAKMANETCVVLIATREKYHSEIEAAVSSYGFLNIIRISESLFHSLHLEDRAEHADKMQRKSHFLQMQTMHAIQLERLREKVRLGARVKVVFLLASISTFNFASLYSAMEKNPLFDAVIMLIADSYRDDLSNKEVLAPMKRYAQTLSYDGFNIVWGYDEHSCPISIESLHADIIIYNSCYLGRRYPAYIQSAHANNVRINISNTLSCYMSYGMWIPKGNYKYHFENDEVLPAWRFFSGNRSEYELAASSAITNGLQHILSGHPLFDSYTSALNLTLPPKLQGKDKLIVIAPHFSMGRGYEITSFHIFWKQIIELLSENPNIGFVFKPHPALSSEIRRRESSGDNAGLPTFAQWQEYCKTWENSPNGIIVADSSFIDWFRHSDCLITDSLSFILTYLPTEKPCIFLANPDATDFYGFFYDYIVPVLESYYVCDNAHMFEKLFDELIIGGNDAKACERKRQSKLNVHNLGHAGKFIADYIEKQIIG